MSQSADVSVPERRRPGTAYAYARQMLRQWIIAAEFAPGERLRQTELAQRLGVSTTPLREALQDLAREGLVVLDPHRGALVRSLSDAEVLEIYELRLALEPLLLAKAAPGLDQAGLAHARELAAAMDEERDPSAFAELNRAFHAELYAPAAASRMAQVVDGVRDAAMPFVVASLSSQGQMDESNAEHHRLLDLLEAGDVAGAQALLASHLRATVAVLAERNGGT